MNSKRFSIQKSTLKPYFKLQDVLPSHFTEFKGMVWSLLIYILCLFHNSTNYFEYLQTLFIFNASFRNGNSGTGPIATPFFSKSSLVGDFYKGELSEALVRAYQGDLAFIMYYAPWDADCQSARKHFETVAHRHYKQVSGKFNRFNNTEFLIL